MNKTVELNIPKSSADRVAREALRDIFHHFNDGAISLMQAVDGVMGLLAPVRVEEPSPCAWTGYLPDENGMQHRCWGFGHAPYDTKDVRHFYSFVPATTIPADTQAMREALEEIIRLNPLEGHLESVTTKIARDALAATGHRAGGEVDPNEIWEQYLEQLEGEPSPQGALAFACEALALPRPDLCSGAK